MKRSARRPARIVAAGAVTVGAALTLSGCVLTSPVVTGTPYPASDGSAGTIDDPATNSTIKLQNFLVVATGKDQPGSLVGAITNTGGVGVTVQLAVADGVQTAAIAETSVTATPGKSVLVGPTDTSLSLSSVPQPPGSVLTLTAKTDSGGTARFTVPVMAATGEYASLTPTPSPSEPPAPAVVPKKASAGSTSSPTSTTN